MNGAAPDFQAMVAAPNPDAKLIAVCLKFICLQEERNELYKTRGAGYLHRVREMQAERDELEVLIVNTPARNQAGVQIKAEAATLIFGQGGIMASMVRSVFSDFMNVSVLGRSA